MSEAKVWLFDDAILRTLKNNYPYLDLNYLKFFRQVYYPIAEISAGIQQETFEDFTVVERSVLQLVGLGFRSVEKIADMMGITVTYVAEVLTLLQDYGLVDDNVQITGLGVRSLKEERKIRLLESKRLFEVDAVNGYPLQLDQTFSEDGMKLQPQLHYDDLILMNATQVSQEELLGEFRRAFLQRDANRVRQVVNVNVRSINAPELQKMKYGCAYLMILEGQQPLLFAKINTTDSRQTVRYKWQPVAVSDARSAQLLQWERPVFFSQKGSQLLTEAVNTFLKQAKNERNQKVFLEGCADTLEKTLFLSTEGYREVSPQLYCLRCEAFTRFSADVLRMLSELGSVNNIYVYVHNNWGGNVLKFVRDIQDQKLAFVCQYLKVLVDQEGFDAVLQKLSAYFEADEICPVIDRIAEKLQLTVPEA